MIITFEGRDWDLNLDKVTYQQGTAIQYMTGLSIAEFEDALDVDEELDADGKPTGEMKDPGPKWLIALGAVYWLMHNQNGDIFPTAKVDFVITDFISAMGEAMQAELDRIKAERAAAKAAKEAEPDPTPPTSPPSSPPGPESSEPHSQTATTPTLPDHDRKEAVTASGPART